MDNMPVVTKNLLIINVLMFVAEPVLGMYGVDMSQMFGLHFFLASDFRLWQPFTYMFVHGNWGHIFWNMFAIWMFGRILEQVWGPKRYLFYYMVCGVGAAFCQELVQFIEYVTELAPYDGVNFGGGYVLPMGDYLNMMNTVGASGAMYGILLAFGMLFPEERLFMLFIPIPIKAKYFVIGYAVIELLLGFAGRPGDTIAHFAHLGGMLFGLLLIMYWRKKKKYGQYYY